VPPHGDRGARRVPAREVPLDREEGFHLAAGTMSSQAGAGLSGCARFPRGLQQFTTDRRPGAS
jgi:hypothetical protein